ncbi:hypothetical protein A1D23_01165 [Chelonobacter oris]|uniref:hypothetical protein n=1 Tax=Chelonobacter oris TaxID=505317 RepID=UPI00244911E8|nr:hypothetical protein [Chelonobacter oris]MDH3000471.1 hypothetical protein [Chelonobacter oris]
MLAFVNSSSAEIIEGKICHADPELSLYNYAGLWEKFEDGWLCNYWQFLSIERWKKIIIVTEAAETEDGNNLYEDSEDEEEFSESEKK